MILWIVLGTALGIIGWMIAYITIKYIFMRDVEKINENGTMMIEL